jgi:hypothetical protein
MNGENTPPVKLRQLIVQAAIDEHWPLVLSQRLAVCGQQSSIGSSADISVISWGPDLNPAVPAAGSNATDRAIKSANMFRAKIMLRWEYPKSGVDRSSDDFASSRSGEVAATPNIARLAPEAARYDP